MANTYNDWPPKRAQVADLMFPNALMLKQRAQQQRQHIRPDGLHALISAAKTPTMRKRSAPSSRQKPMHSHPWRSNKSQQGITVNSGVPEAVAWTPGTGQKSDTLDSGGTDSAHPLMLLTRSQTAIPGGRSWQRSLSGTRQSDFQTFERFVQKHHLDAAPADGLVSPSSAQPVHITTRLPYTPAGTAALEEAVKPSVQFETEALIIKVNSLQAETMELQARAADRQKLINSGTRRTEFSRTDQGSHQSAMKSQHIAPAVNLWVSSPTPGSPPARAFSNSNADLSGDFRLTSQLGPQQSCQASPLPHGVLHRPIDPLHIRARKSLIRPATTPEGKQRPFMHEAAKRPATQQSGRKPTALETTKWSSKWAPIGLGDSSASGIAGNVVPSSSHHLGMRDNVRTQSGLPGDWQSWKRDQEGAVQHAQHSGCRMS